MKNITLSIVLVGLLSGCVTHSYQTLSSREDAIKADDIELCSSYGSAKFTGDKRTYIFAEQEWNNRINSGTNAISAQNCNSIAEMSYSEAKKTSCTNSGTGQFVGSLLTYGSDLGHAYDSAYSGC
ncbi:hypothetical protein H4F18_00305 [Vibrio scophthalmi]|uniref:hypothetical protein n=1 Tax=Vibrio scophthalmi TaxID=45658 RepID=UPI002FEE8F84